MDFYLRLLSTGAARGITRAAPDDHACPQIAPLFDSETGAGGASGRRGFPGAKCNYNAASRASRLAWTLVTRRSSGALLIGALLAIAGHPGHPDHPGKARQRVTMSGGGPGGPGGPKVMKGVLEIMTIWMHCTVRSTEYAWVLPEM